MNKKDIDFKIIERKKTDNKKSEETLFLRIDLLNDMIEEAENRINVLGNEIVDFSVIKELDFIFSNVSNTISECDEYSLNSEDIEIINKMRTIDLRFRNLSNTYTSKKLELLSKNINNQMTEAEEKTKDLIGNQIFSIASVFLGISLTSAIVAGVGQIPPEFIILYFITAGVIAVDILGISAILLRKIDKKTIIITLIASILTISWCFVAYKAYNYNKIVVNNSSIQEQSKDN